jgi:beta-lactamase class A
MARNMQKLVLGNALKPQSRARLRAWLIGCKTGKTKLQANMPKTWIIGDKTGSGEHNTSNDVAIAWPPHRPPIIVAAYFTGSKASDIIRDGTLPAVGLSTALRFGA